MNRRLRVALRIVAAVWPLVRRRPCAGTGLLGVGLLGLGLLGAIGAGAGEGEVSSLAAGVAEDAV